MHIEIEDVARGWVKVGGILRPEALPFVVRGCDVLIAHVRAVVRIREGDRVLMAVEDGRWVKPTTTGAWRMSGWTDLPGFEDTIATGRR